MKTAWIRIKAPGSTYRPVFRGLSTWDVTEATSPPCSDGFVTLTASEQRLLLDALNVRDEMLDRDTMKLMKKKKLQGLIWDKYLH